MQPTHSSFHLGGTDVLYLLPLIVLDKDTREEPHKVRRVKKNICLAQGHAIIYAPSQMLDPHSILPTHMLFLSTLFFLGAHEQRFYIEISNHGDSE